MILIKSVFTFVQGYFDEAKKQDNVIGNKAYRKRAALKNNLIFAGNKSGDKIQGNGDSEKCFKPNSNYKSLFLNICITWCMDQGSLQILSIF